MPNRSTLSETESKLLLAPYGLPIVQERTADNPQDAVTAARFLGYPVVAKLEGENIAHKTERGLVRLGLGDDHAVAVAAEQLLAAAVVSDGPVRVLIAPMIEGSRELIVGMVRDPQFGPTVMLGFGGVLAEVVADVVFRPLPITAAMAIDMIDELRTRQIFDEFRGEAPVDRAAIAELLVGLSRMATQRPEVVSVDVNPLIIQSNGRPVAVDALVEIGAPGPNRPDPRRRPSNEAFLALFEPKGVLVTGASTHPGKFGFVALHNVLAAGYTGRVFATNLQSETVLGIETVADIVDIPDNAIDLVFICTPAKTNTEILRACSARGVKAAFVTSAGYSESGEDGRIAELQLVEVADELGILLAGPNGQGLVSTPADLCAQIVAPFPPRGTIGVASQSGNLVSSFLNLSRCSGVGISRAVSAGNAAAVGVADYLDFFAEDSATTVGLAYLEGIADGQELMKRLGAAAQRQPLVLLKGGTTASGAKAAASHTGSLAADGRIFDGACRAAGITRVISVDEAFDAAASFATQPLPRGPGVVVLTTAGGWGVLTADAVAKDRDLELLALPEDLLLAIDEHLPPRWSRSNPIDCAGGETKDTIPNIMRLIVEHPAVDALIFIGLGIQSNQARMMREGRFHPENGLDRIVEYHERQDRRFARTAAGLSEKSGKPVLCASDLAVTDPSNPGPHEVRATGRLCYPSSDRAVVALGHMYRYARFKGLAGK